MRPVYGRKYPQVKARQRFGPKPGKLRIIPNPTLKLHFSVLIPLIPFPVGGERGNGLLVGEPRAASEADLPWAIIFCPYRAEGGEKERRKTRKGRKARFIPAQANGLGNGFHPFHQAPMARDKEWAGFQP